MRKKQKLYKLLLDGSKPWWEEVKGEMVEDLGVLAFATQDGGLWGVINMRSGQPIGKQWAAKRNAIKSAKEYIESVGLAQYLDWQKQDLFEYGESPAMEPSEIQVYGDPKEPTVDRTCVRE